MSLQWWVSGTNAGFLRQGVGCMLYGVAGCCRLCAGCDGRTVLPCKHRGGGGVCNNDNISIRVLIRYRRSIKNESEVVKTIKMAKTIVVALLLFACFHQVYTRGGWLSGNQCRGTGCYCTRTPVTISCEDGSPNDVPVIIRNAATVVSITGKEMTPLSSMDMSEFYNLKDLFIDINDDRVCLWMHDVGMTFPDVVIKNDKNNCTSVLDSKTDAVKPITAETDQDYDKSNTTLIQHDSLSEGTSGWIIFGNIAMVIIIGFCVFCIVRKMRYVPCKQICE